MKNERLCERTRRLDHLVVGRTTPDRTRVVAAPTITATKKKARTKNAQNKKSLSSPVTTCHHLVMRQEHVEPSRGAALRSVHLDDTSRYSEQIWAVSLQWAGHGKHDRKGLQGHVQPVGGVGNTMGGVGKKELRPGRKTSRRLPK